MDIPRRRYLAHDTFARVFAGIDPEQFRSCFMDWVNSVSQLTQGEVIALDGKTLRRSHDRPSGKEAIHMVSAWASENSLVLGQVKVDEKSNEISALPELLHLLDVSGCSDQLTPWAEKDSWTEFWHQGKLLEDGSTSCGRRTAFDNMQHDFCRKVESGHGRVETRSCWTIDDPQLSYLDTRGDWLTEHWDGHGGTMARGPTVGGNSLTSPVWSRTPNGSASDSKPLGHRKPGALGAGHVLQGRRPDTNRERTAKPGRSPAMCPEPAPP